MTTPHEQPLLDDPLEIGGRHFTSRFLLGTGKFESKTALTESIAASGAEIVTVALRRINLREHEENILTHIPRDRVLLVNTSGARTANEAVRIARIAREAGYGNWVKIEVINDSKYLLPDNAETIRATEILAGEGFVVLPYMFPELAAARALVAAGAATVMPLAAPIGSNQGLQARAFIKILIDEIPVPVIVDAGIGAPSQAAEAMELGAAAVLANTAIATASNAPEMARAFAEAIRAGRRAFRSGLPTSQATAEASSPLTGFLYNTGPRP